MCKRGRPLLGRAGQAVPGVIADAAVYAVYDSSVRRNRMSPSEEFDTGEAEDGRG
jgi:hypothetical protein